MKITISIISGLLLAAAAHAELLDPDCTAGKAAKSAAMKSTIGVGNRCTPKEAAKDELGIDGDKKKDKDDDGRLKNVRDRDD